MPLCDVNKTKNAKNHEAIRNIKHQHNFMTLIQHIAFFSLLLENFSNTHFHFISYQANCEQRQHMNNPF
jgi:hypothetical protein